MTKPNFFIIGAPKSGTTALAHYLSEHKDVFFCKPKELFFWSDDHPRAKERHNVHTLDYYLSYFRNSHGYQAIGEGSTNYLQSRTAIKNILNFDSKSRFIVLLRDPTEVAYGMHGELMRHFFENEPNFSTAWDKQEERAKGLSIPEGCVMENQLQYFDVASYGSQLERLFDLVPENQRRVFLFEQFKSDAKSVYESTLEFLKLPSDNRTEFPRMNPARQYRSGLVGKLYQNPPSWVEPTMKRLRTLYTAAPESIKTRIASVMSKQEPREELSKKFTQRLRNAFAEEISLTEKLLGEDLSHWKQNPSKQNSVELR